MESINIRNHEVHLWTLNPQHILDSTHLWSLLSPDERKKVNRYRLPQAQNIALLTRAFIRLILSQYETQSASQWVFSISPLGKPEVTNTKHPLRFNLSHNNNLIICAITLINDIGCDIENLERKINAKSITQRYFSTYEQQQLNTLPQNQQNAFFFKLWTLKEAFVKATGQGLAQGLNTFSFDLSSYTEQEKHISLSFHAQCTEKKPLQWQSHLFYPDDQHCIALCVKSTHSLNIKHFNPVQSAALFKSTSADMFV
ncbi:4'-phosphopantetheinyl transferase family protein [Psychromonas sp. CD1]|uniref:4'-phosphopantetheinyl transferase family protein n=1 Tax=Psychromonas sp. CD1 TaxID=1979839 RepID=UPI000B9B01E0|nr:4'-phosphopantetheinyl transferase superfamily protein [Psychromonas sp. CD1]